MDANLGQIADRLREIGLEMEEVMNYSAILPEDSHHRSAMFIRLPYPKVAQPGTEVFERLARLIESVNKPDTIKMDVYTVIGKHIVQGFVPHTELTANGDFDPDAFHPLLSQPYVLQIVVDVVQPDAMAQTIEALKGE